MFFLYDPLTAAVNLAYMGFLLQTTLRIEAHVNCPWYVFYVTLALLITLLIYRGIEISAAFVTWLTVIEVLIVIVLAIASLMHPGDGRLHLQDFVSVHDFSKKGLYLAIVFSIFTFTGFEAVAPLAEETRDPPRHPSLDCPHGRFLRLHFRGHTHGLGQQPHRHLRPVG